MVHVHRASRLGGPRAPLGARPPRGSKKKLKGKEVDGKREKDKNELQSLLLKKQEGAICDNVGLRAFPTITRFTCSHILSLHNYLRTLAF